MVRIRYATPEDDAEEVPADQRCIWPGCTRRRAAGRAAGSGRQREYCEKASRPEDGGGPEHNARNRWALRERTLRAAGPGDGPRDAGLDDPGRRGAGPRDAGQQAPDEGDPGAGAGAARGEMPLSAAKLHASDLLEQARRQHASALAALAAERELYARLAGQFEIMADPAALDLEIAAVPLKAGRAVAARTGGRDQDGEGVVTGAGDAGRRADSAEERPSRARKDADQARREAEAARQDAARSREQAERARAEAAQSRQAAEQAKAGAARQVAEAAARADAAAVRADDAVRAAQERTSAERERADAASRAHAEAAQRLGAARAAEQALRAEIAAAAARADGQVERHRADLARSGAEAGGRTSETARRRAGPDREIT